MTSPGEDLPVTLPAAQARQVLDLLLIAGHVSSALRARGLKRDLALDNLSRQAATAGSAATSASSRPSAST